MNGQPINPAERPTYAQTHPAMAYARNIVNQVLDESGADIGTRQRINDDCDQFVAWMLEQHAANLATALAISRHREGRIRALGEQMCGYGIGPEILAALADEDVANA